MCETLHLMRQIILNTHSFIIAVKTNIYDLWTLNSLPPLDINYWVFNNDNFLCSYYRTLWPRIHLMDDSKIMLHKLKLSKVTNQHSIAQQRHYDVHSMNVIFLFSLHPLTLQKASRASLARQRIFRDFLSNLQYLHRFSWNQMHWYFVISTLFTQYKNIHEKISTDGGCGTV